MLVWVRDVSPFYIMVDEEGGGGGLGTKKEVRDPCKEDLRDFIEGVREGRVVRWTDRGKGQEGSRSRKSWKSGVEIQWNRLPGKD